jgi:prolyl 4-hydroxylase
MPSSQFLDLLNRYSAGDQSAFPAMMDLAQSGDSDALFTAAEFRLLGIGGAVDATAAKEFVDRAAALGHAEARRAQAYFMAAGVGTAANPDAARHMLEKIVGEDRFVAVQLAFLDHMRCRERLKAADRKLISTDPHVELIQALFSPEECRYLQMVANPWLRPAQYFSEDGGTRVESYRDADNMFFPPLVEDLVIQAINHCIADATNCPFSWGEPLQVVRYRPGQQFQPHHDAHGTGADERKRILTALLYLNSEYEGGETHFTQLGIRVRGGPGDLLFFRNLDAAGAPDMRLVHAGLPVTKGEKWLATRWVRDGEFFGSPRP